MTFEVGGDEVAEVIFTNGDKQSLTTGDGGTFSAGMEFHPSAMPKLGLRTLVGWKFSTSAAENVDIMFTRFPIEVVASYAVTPDWRIGAGVTHHANINLDFDGLAQNAKYDPATGATLEVGWKWAALTYTSMEYRSRYGDTFDASAIGISVSYVFGKRSPRGHPPARLGRPDDRLPAVRRDVRPADRDDHGEGLRPEGARAHCGDPDRTGALGRFSVRRVQEADGIRHGILRDGGDGVERGTALLEHLVIHASGQAVAERGQVRHIHGVPGREGQRHRVGAFALGAQDAHACRGVAHEAADAAHETAAAHAHHQRARRRQSLKDLERHRACAGQQGASGARTDKGRAEARGVCTRCVLGGIVVRLAGVHARAERRDPVALYVGRGRRHEDRGGNAELPRGHGHADAVVAG